MLPQKAGLQRNNRVPPHTYNYLILFEAPHPLACSSNQFCRDTVAFIIDVNNKMSEVLQIDQSNHLMGAIVLKEAPQDTPFLG